MLSLPAFLLGSELKGLFQHLLQIVNLMINRNAQSLEKLCIKFMFLPVREQFLPTASIISFTVERGFDDLKEVISLAILLEFVSSPIIVEQVCKRLFIKGIEQMRCR